MSRSAKAVPPPELTQCRDSRGPHDPPHPSGSCISRRLDRRRSEAATPASSTTDDDLELREIAEASAYYFLESHWGHPDEP